MTQLLINHAKRRVWHSPEQDHQFNISLRRLTADGGFVGAADVMWHQVLSPTRNLATRKFHHVYQVGQISNITLNLVNMLHVDKWVSAEQMVDDFDLLIEVYFESGAVVPLEYVWLMRDFTNNLLVCVYHDKIIDYGTLTLVDDSKGVTIKQKVNCDNDNLVIRFYSNSFQHYSGFNSMSTVSGDSIKIVSEHINNQSDFNLFIQKTKSIVSQFNNKGMGNWYIDGFLVNAITTGYNSSLDGHVLTYVHDETYISAENFVVNELPVFTSKRDRNKTKYLIVTATKFSDYFDDVDFYVIARNDNSFKGVYINRSLESTIRQVTNDTYALDTQVVDWYIRHHDIFVDAKSIEIRVIKRHGGMRKEVFSQKNRINELFLAGPDIAKRAMTNTDALVKEWQAAELENSSYMTLVGAKSNQISAELITDAYGYPGLTYDLANPYTSLVNGQLIFPKYSNLPLLENNSKFIRSVFAYSSDGILTNQFDYNHPEEKIDYNLVNALAPSATKFEVFRLKTANADKKISAYYDSDLYSSDLSEFEYRCYICPLVNGKPSGDCIDVTGSKFYKHVPAKGNTNEYIRWDLQLLSEAGAIGGVVINSFIYYNTYRISNHHYTGSMVIDIEATEVQANRLVKRAPLVAFGVVEVFCDGEQMIQGLDFFIKWPRIVIINQQVLNKKHVNVAVRGYGLPDPDTMKPYTPVEVGFAKSSILSFDNEYDISKNRTSKLVINSRVTSKEENRFDEYTDSGAVITDGRPYMLQDYLVDIKRLTDGGDTTKLYKQMVDIDNRLGKYLTQFLTSRTPKKLKDKKPVIMTERWQLVSPFTWLLINSILKLRISFDIHTENFSSSSILGMVRPHLWALEFDPVLKLAPEHLEYVYIRPHPFDEPITLTLNNYNFLKVAIDKYLDSRVNLSKYIIIGDKNGR